MRKFLVLLLILCALTSGSWAAGALSPPAGDALAPGASSGANTVAAGKTGATTIAGAQANLGIQGLFPGPVGALAGESFGAQNINSTIAIQGFSNVAPWTWARILSGGRIRFPHQTNTVTGAADNGSGLIRLALDSTTGWNTGNVMCVIGVGGTTEAVDCWYITVIDATHVDLAVSATTSLASVFTHAYTSGGRAMGFTTVFARSGQYCGPYTTVGTIAWQLRRIVEMSPLPDFVGLTGCTNDVAGALSSSAAFARFSAEIGMVLDKGIDIIYDPIPPQTTNFDSADLVQADAFNRNMYELCSRHRPDLFSTNSYPAKGRLVCLDIAYADNVVDGTPVANLRNSDGTHRNSRAAFITGTQILNLLAPRLAPLPGYHTTFRGFYNATTNPKGNLLTNGSVNDGLMVGTGGSKLTNAGVTPTGNVADRWQALRLSGGSTATMVMSKISRPDGLPGECNLMTVDTLADGSGVEQYELIYNGPISSGFAAGDAVGFSATYFVVDEPVSLTAVEFTLNADATSSQDVTLKDGVGGTNSGEYGIPMMHEGILTSPEGGVVLPSDINVLRPAFIVRVNATAVSHAAVALCEAWVRKL